MPNDVGTISDKEEDDDSEIVLGVTGSSIDEQDKLLKNPALRKLFNQLLDEHIRQDSEKGESSGSTLLSNMSPQEIGKNKPRVEIMKSPSDTMVYAPALAKRSEPLDVRPVDFVNQIDNSEQLLINKISNFVDNARQEHDKREQRERSSRRASEVVVPGQEEALQKTDQDIIEAEKFKAAIEAPPGNRIVNNDSFDTSQLIEALKISIFVFLML